MDFLTVEILNHELSAILFIRSYVELHFEETKIFTGIKNLQMFTLPTVCQGGCRFLPNEDKYYLPFLSLIGTTLTGLSQWPDAYNFVFSSGTSLEILRHPSKKGELFAFSAGAEFVEYY